MIDRLIGTFAPHPCCVCGKIGETLCYSCRYDIENEIWTECVLCERPCGQSGMCRFCNRKSVFEQLWAVGKRRDDLQKLIDEYKFGSKRESASVIAQLIDSCLPILPREICLVSIPTSPRSRRRRGFDHMGLIAESLANIRNLPTASPLVRVFNQELHTMDRQQRVAARDKLFALSGDPVPQNILLIDDILTTGTTMCAAAKLLKDAGASRIYGVIVARQSM